MPPQPYRTTISAPHAQPSNLGPKSSKPTAAIHLKTNPPSNVNPAENQQRREMAPCGNIYDKLAQLVAEFRKARKRSLIQQFVWRYRKMPQKTINGTLRDCAFCGRITVRRKVTKTRAIGAAGAQVPYKDKVGGSNPSSPTMNFSRSSCILSW